MKSNIKIKHALEELNFIQQGDYSEDEFFLKFKVRATTPVRILDLSQLFIIAEILKKELSKVVSDLTRLVHKKDSSSNDLEHYQSYHSKSNLS